MRRVGKRILLLASTLLGITLIAFVVVRLAPGDPLASQGDGALRAGGATLAQMRDYRRRMGLDDPLLSGYARWLWRLVGGDLGTSFRDGRSVTTVLGEALPMTLLLSIPALLLGYLAAVPLALLSAARAGGLLDRALSWLTFFAWSLPVQWVALLAIAAVSGSRWPIQGFEGPRSMVLPVLCLSYAPAAALIRFLRSSLLEQLGQDYVRTARAKGLPETRVLLRHVLPNSLLSLITLFGLTLPALISGAVLVERMFGLPGMGRLTFDAVLGRDTPVLMGVVLLAGMVTMIGMLASDALFAAADPRISLRGSGP
jgi:peptide/nickel transport system permease protein